MNWKKRKGKVKVMRFEREVWMSAFAWHMDRGDRADDAAAVANEAVRICREGPLGDGGRCGNELCPRYAGRAEQKKVQPAPGVARCRAEGDDRVRPAPSMDAVQALRTPPDALNALRGAAIGGAKQAFKTGDRVWVVPSTGSPPSYDTVRSVEGVEVLLFNRFGRYRIDLGEVQHAPEVSHDQC